MADQHTEQVQSLISVLAADSSIPSDTKSKLIVGLSNLPSPLQNDRIIYRMVVASLGIAALVTVIGGIVIKLVASGDLPQGVLALGSTAVGALAGLLAPSPMARQ